MVLDDPSARRRLSAEDMLHTKQQIIKLHLDGRSTRQIEAELGIGRMTVHRTIKLYRRALAHLDAENVVDPELDDLDPELVSMAAAWTPRMSCEDVRSRREFDQLNELEKFRRAHLPPDHPAKAI